MEAKQQQRILEAIAQARANFEGSDSKFATSLGISPSQYSRITRGDTQRVLSEANWISIARQLGVNMGNQPEWNTANTSTFQFITAQLEHCQQNSVSAMLCDYSDIGKTYTARHYARNHKNAVYIDCSQVKTRQLFVRALAKSFGVGSTGRFADVFEDLVYYLKVLPTPLIILDEAGDLRYEAFLEIKSLWNATDTCCGWYMMGADGLRDKIQRAINNHKVGYAEIFSRFGRNYGTVVPASQAERELYAQRCAAQIIKANAPDGTDVNKLLHKTMGQDGMPSLRRIYRELTKLRASAKTA